MVVLRQSFKGGEMANFVINEYKLDIVPQGSYPVVYLSQYEDGRDIKFYMLNRGFPLEIPQSGISVFVSGLKANGGYFEHSCEVVDNNTVIMHLETDMTDVSGRGAATLTFTDLDNKKVISAKFIINVQDGISDDGIEVPTEAETILQQILDEIRSEAAKLDLDMDALDAKIEEFKSDVNADVSEFKSDVNADMDSFKSDVNDDIDVINARVDNFLASQTGVSNGEKFTITPLYSAPTDGSASSYVTLSDDPINYPYLIIQFGVYTSGTSGYKTVDRAIVSGSDFRAATQANPFICNAFGVFDNASEGGTRYYPLRAVQLSMWKYTTGETQYKAYRSRFDSLDWSGMGSQDAYGYSGSGNDFIVRAVYGIKFVDAGTSKDPELTDIRIGADGYSYPSAGAAVRSQMKGQIEGTALNLGPFDDETTIPKSKLDSELNQLLDGMSSDIDTIEEKLINNNATIAELSASDLNNVNISIPNCSSTYTFLIVQSDCQGWKDIVIIPTRFVATCRLYMGYNHGSACTVAYTSNNLLFKDPSFITGVTSATIRVYGIRR